MHALCTTAAKSCTALGTLPPPVGTMGASHSVMVGDAAMDRSRNIIQNAVRSRDHTTLMAAVKAAGLVDTLSGKGPFTVFAPTNAAFAALPDGTVQTLLEPENKALLTKILTHHVVAGDYTAADIGKLVGKGGGAATIKTVEGEPLTFAIEHGAATVTDVRGHTAQDTVAKVRQSNGGIHVISKVLMP